MSELCTQSVLVAMSGGVDSSIAAKLMVDAGYRVAGLTMLLAGSGALPCAQAQVVSVKPQQLAGEGSVSEQLAGEGFVSAQFAAKGSTGEEPATKGSTGEEPAAKDSSGEEPAKKPASGLDHAADARRVCERLGIPHEVLDCREYFESQVIAPFCEGYLSGLTPNPCFRCNVRLKFGLLQRYCREQGFDYMATGHYVRRETYSRTGRLALRMAGDPSKDQSYVLAGITQEQLAHAIFPLGNMNKTQVRAMAAQAGLAVAQKAESQDICFVPDGNYAAFIERWQGAPLQAGDIVNAQGAVLGRHAGLARYTVGQRKGIGIAAACPYYVTGKDASSNQLVVGFADELLSRELAMRDVNLMAVPELAAGQRVFCKTSYRQKPQPAAVQSCTDGQEATLVFDEPQRKTAPGQAVVLYDQDGFVLAGGIACVS